MTEMKLTRDEAYDIIKYVSHYKACQDMVLQRTNDKLTLKIGALSVPISFSKEGSKVD